MPLSSYCIRFDHPESSNDVVLFSTRTAATVSIPRDALRDIERGVLAPDERESLSELGLLVPSIHEEKQEMLSYIDRMNAISTTLKPIVVMNLDCNLACSYCFEGTRKGKHFLSEETADNLVGFIGKQLNGKKEIYPTFYGGEPLLSVDLIARISRRLRELANERDACYEFRMITNGTLLTRRVVERLKPLGLRSVSVTLDGPREVHNSFRPFKSGAGSFDTIIKNIHDVCNLIEVQIGGNYTRDNYRDFPFLLDYLLESGLGPKLISSVEFSPVFQETPDFVPDFHGGCATLKEPWIADAGVFLRHEILSHGFATTPVEPTVCMIERPDYIVVNWDGGLYKCPGLIGRKDCCVGNLKGGLIDYRRSHALDNWKTEECLACSYLPLCFGGCRYMKLLQDGAMNGINCRKEYFDKTLAQFVIQDIKYDL